MAPRKKETMVAREACVIVVGARPPVYARIRTQDRRTGEWIEIDNQGDVRDPGDSGVPYTFKAFQKVNPNHPAVKEAPNRFMPLSDVEEVDLEAVTA